MGIPKSPTTDTTPVPDLLICPVLDLLVRFRLAAGAILAFARALGEFGATIMVAGNIAGQTTTAPVAVYMAVEGGEFDVARQYVLVLAVMNFAFLLFLNVWTARFDGGRR